MSEIVFEAVKPQGKQCILSRDGDYYEIVVGAFNAFNHSGHFYKYSPNSALAKIFQDSSDFMRRIKAGQLFAEYGHPKIVPGTSKHEAFIRRLTVDEDRVCAHIRSVRLVPDLVTDIKGRKCIGVVAWVKPFGPFAQMTKEALDDPSMNPAFSIRCFTKDTPINGVLYKEIVEIVTWDGIIAGEPGIATACKYATPSIESYTVTDLNHIKQKLGTNTEGNYSQESITRVLPTIDNLIGQTNLFGKIPEGKLFNW